MEDKATPAILWYIYMFICVPSCLSAADFQVRTSTGQDVTLSCGTYRKNLLLPWNCISWYLVKADGVAAPLISYDCKVNEVHVHDSQLMGRIELAGQDLIIKDTRASDAGNYTCFISFFLGDLRHKTTTNLVVHVFTDWTLRMIALGGFLLIIVGMAATTYVIILRKRRETCVKTHVNRDAVADV
uniref:uncharacterized protein LOC131105228 isoform X2 n=1 Tax=Doryrhamphus excisus TaxID=161450 RepID=UPI0025AE1D9B|nr:uncharacterized protein LOC131105228 isoform X2 [Doryrhamphus excisus]